MASTAFLLKKFLLEIMDGIIPSLIFQQHIMMMMMLIIITIIIIPFRVIIENVRFAHLVDKFPDFYAAKSFIITFS
jgi:hypothetical protein